MDKLWPEMKHIKTARQPQKQNGSHILRTLLLLEFFVGYRQEIKTYQLLKETFSVTLRDENGETF